MAVRKEELEAKMLTILREDEIAEVNQLEELIDRELKIGYPTAKYREVAIPLVYHPSAAVMAKLRAMYREAGWKLVFEVFPYKRLPGDTIAGWLRLS